MDRSDRELLQKQLRAINPAPRRDGVVIVTVVVVFLAGMTLGGLLAGRQSGPTLLAANDAMPAAPYPGTPPPSLRQ